MTEIVKKLKTLTVFNNLLEDKIISSFIKTVNEKSIEEYSKFVSFIYNEGGDLSEYIFDIACKDDNVFLRSTKMREPVPVCISYSILRELKILQLLSGVTSLNLKEYLEYEELSDYDNTPVEFVSGYMNKIKDSNR